MDPIRPDPHPTTPRDTTRLWRRAQRFASQMGGTATCWWCPTCGSVTVDLTMPTPPDAVPEPAPQPIHAPA